MLRGSRWEDTSQLAGTRIGFGAPGAATLQQLQPRCTVCSRSKTRPSRACSPRSGPNPAWGASGGRPTPRLGGRPAHSSYGESSHLRRTGEAVPWASSSPHPGPGPPQLSRASGPCRGPGLRPQLRREGGLRGEHCRGKCGIGGARGGLLCARTWREVQAGGKGAGLVPSSLRPWCCLETTLPGSEISPAFQELRGNRSTIFTLCSRDTTLHLFPRRLCTRLPSSRT